MPKAFFEKKNVIVAGGAGMIGSHLCDELLKTCKVICIDNFISSDESNIDHLLRHPDFAFINHDLTEPIDLEVLPELEKFKIRFQGIQEIYDLACPTSPKNFMDNIIATALANSYVVKNNMELAVKYKAKYMLFSSSVIYGPRVSDDFYFDEDYEGVVKHLTPRACYDEGKRFAETLVNTYKTQYKIDAKIARVFRVYGPRMLLNDGRMMPDFIVNALDNKPLAIYGDNNFSTSLCYVSDIVEGAIKFMSVNKDIGPVNLGSDEDLILAEVAQKIINLSDSKSKVVFKKSLLFMSQLGLPSIVKAKKEFGWMPMITMETGLKKVIDYARATRPLIKMGRKVVK